ncbi:hypothetical protein KBJ94_27900 [Pseudomonas sp. ITA]|uniref:F4 family fimbrial subunit n=1 Tax=Pseudomonas sp. ITA TaxID=2825841 RepID=UPI0024963A7A|nr:hypothetical protein [Pseudomonas sp. ITA]MDI2145873.1 hypothetical protein [Pseudomonas sp. ITA]
MNINKIYAAVATVALGLSPHAFALSFTDGNLTGGVDFGGDVTVPVSTNQWQWATGNAINFASTQVTQMTNGFKTLTVPATTNLPLLVGQTKAATIGSLAGGIDPQIAFTDAAGTAVVPTWDTSGNTGKGTLTLPVTAADGTTALGSMILKVKVGGVKAATDTAGTSVTLTSTNSRGTGTSLFGTVAQPSAGAGALATGTTGAGWNNALGANADTILLSQLNTANGKNATTWGVNTQAVATGFTDPGWYYSGTYGLGIAQGDTIVVNFTNPVSANTTWKAPLKVTVTYL